jgi:hypothetical protein
MQREIQIDDFVEHISGDDLRTLFDRYSHFRYGHLMLDIVSPLSLSELRNALKIYLKKFILHQDVPDDERETKLWRSVSSNDCEALKQTIIGDQFFEEPLFHIVNQNSENYELSEVIARLSRREIFGK